MLFTRTMQSNNIANRRLTILLRTLSRVNGKQPTLFLRLCSTDSRVSIGSIFKDVKDPKRPEYVPRKYLFLENTSQTTLHHLRWIMQKDLLGQDIFLLGPPGPLKRLIALQYLELTRRELEYVALSRDTTEADLKQRREIIGGTAKYFDQSAVRAAIEGRILILEGIEKAERNVLPVLNNLLENREMHLEDGRLLIPAERYDTLLNEHGQEKLENWKLVRVDENFRVIALGLPVPKFAGNLLDPPLRSRFQARDISHISYQENFNTLCSLAPKADQEKLSSLLEVSHALLSPDSSRLNLPYFPLDNVHLAAKILETHSNLSPYNLFYRLYPYKSFLQREGIKSIETLLSSLKIKTDIFGPIQKSIEQIKNVFKTVPFQSQINSNNHYVETEYQNQLVEELLQSVLVSDVCLIGPRGCGKSVTVEKMASIAGYDVEQIVLYQDMTSRDLIQQRTTLENGDTVWKNSPLVNAALDGKLAILDGIHRIHPSTLAVLHRLVHDRELQLHDGQRLIRADRFDELVIKHDVSPETLRKNGVLRVHPSFRIIALAEPQNNLIGANKWLSSELLSLFLFHEMRTLTKTEEAHIISSLHGTISKPLYQIIDLAHKLRSSPDTTMQNLSQFLSTRQLLRIASRMSTFPQDSAHDIIQNTFLSQFLPTLARNALETMIDNLGIEKSLNITNQPRKCEVLDGVLTVGNTSCVIHEPDSLSKVPDVLFYDVPQHIELIERLLQDFQLGSHILLVGNQGVGKNKITDRFLQLLNRSREYIQLHRDTTVQTLTLQPTVTDGVVVYEDSPLVKAVKNGYVLVIDEADKAPTHVTCILKTLVESGQMILSDGRRIVRHDTGEHLSGNNIIVTHPDFRMIVLANRPGFPFLGNDFFGALGDLFSCHAVDNPSIDSETQLLYQYGPDVPKDIIQKLVLAFGELRSMADQGLVSYPYSTREVVNVVKHLQKFPKEDVTNVILNVFDFDRYSEDMVGTLSEVLAKYGFPTSEMFSQQWLSIQKAKEYVQVTVERKSGLDVSSPKHGKEDPKNEPHVGGNTWAGGTGGRDTAGLGGKGGPYRLDKGHKVHQLSQAEKDDIPEHVKQAAREMGRKAFEDKLREIRMSQYDATLYEQFSSAVARPVQSLRVILDSLQAKTKERQWMHHQTSGELDDAKLIEGLTGEKNIYRRRTDKDPDIGAPQMKPKRLKLIVDVSGSMYRFNSYDGRLDRELETVVLVMEAFFGFEDKIRYDITGHSGETPSIEFINELNPPKNNKERLEVIRTMHAHSQFCWPGDNTLQATEYAVNKLAGEDCDEAIVVVLSDANLQRYGIPAKQFAEVLNANSKVNAYAVFIGSLGDEAERIVRLIPSGKAFICDNLSELPQILKQIFTVSVVR